MAKRTGATVDVIRAISKLGPGEITIANLCDLTGHTYKSISQVVGRLKNQGILRKSVKHPTRGRPQVYRVLKKNQHLMMAKITKKMPASKPKPTKKSADEIDAATFGAKVFRYWEILKTENVNLEAQAREAKSAVQGLQNEVDRLSKDLASAERRIKHMEEQANKRQHQKVVSHSSYIELKKYSERLETEVDELRTKLDRKKKTFPMSEIANVR